MFNLKTSLEEREKSIKKYLRSEEHDYDTAIGYLMAAANFEWVARRAMSRIGKHYGLKKAQKTFKEEKWINGGLNAMKEVWKNDLEEHTHIKFVDMFSDYNGINKAFKLRNELIHGFGTSRKKSDSIPLAYTLMRASSELVKYCNTNFNMNVMDNLNKKYETPSEREERMLKQ